MKRLAVGFCVLLAGSALAQGGLGDATYVACEPDAGIQQRFRRARPGRFATSAPLTGTVSPQVEVFTFRPGSRTVMVAVDSRKPDALAPSLIRLDFDGAGKFNDEQVVPLTLKASSDGRDEFRFGPATFQLAHDGQGIPLTVEGRYFKYGSGARVLHYLALGLGTALQADCQFGDKVHPVRIIDDNSNLQLGEEGRETRYRGLVVGMPGSDATAVDVGDGSFTKSVQKAFYGQPVLVDGKYYDVRFSPDGKRIEATELKLKTGRLRIDHGEYVVTLSSDQQMLRLAGGKEPLVVPEGRYTLVQFEDHARAAPDKGPWVLACGLRALYSGKVTTIDIVADKLATLKIGTPMTGSLQIAERRGVVSFNGVLADVTGARIDSLVGPDGDPPPPPKVKVRSADGELVYTGQMKYG